MLAETNPLILLVEDNPDDEALLFEAIAHNNIKCEIAVVRDGAEALDYVFGRGAYIGRVLPQLILLDLNLPVISGLEVIKHLRSNSLSKLIPIVVLSTSKEDHDVISAYSLGANSYIQKPIDFRIFLSRINQLGQYWLSLNEYPPIPV
jgi:two-component system, response regulator